MFLTIFSYKAILVENAPIFTDPVGCVEYARALSKIDNTSGVWFKCMKQMKYKEENGKNEKTHKE